MPKYGIHYIVLDKSIKGLRGNNELHRLFHRNRSWANIGAIGPDLFFWGTDYETVAIFYEVYKKFDEFKQKIEKILEPVKEKIEEIKNEVEEELDRMIPLESTKDLLRTVKEEIEETEDLYDAAKLETILAAITIGVGPRAISNFFEYFSPDRFYNRPELDWYWFDMLHYRRTGEFAKNLIKISEEMNDDRARAYAYGYLTHIATDLVGHSFVNQLSGAPYRSHVWRHVTIENFMDTRAFFVEYGKNINSELLEALSLPDPEEFSGSKVPELLERAFWETYDCAMHPIRLKGEGFYTKKDISAAYEMFYEVLKLISSTNVEPPEEPFTEVAAILNEALRNAVNTPPPPAPPFEHNWEDVIVNPASFSPEDWVSAIERWANYVQELVQWMIGVTVAIIDAILATMFAVPAAVLLALLYGIQLFLYCVYRNMRFVLALYGFVTPEPDAIFSPFGILLTTLSAGCSRKYFPGSGLPTMPSNLLCTSFRNLEPPHTKAGFYSYSITTSTESFIGSANEAIDEEVLSKYALSRSPKITRRLQGWGNRIGNAVSLALYMMRNARNREKERLVFADWDLDSDRGYAYKCWGGFICKTLHSNRELRNLDDLRVHGEHYVTGREGDKCFSLFQPDKPYILEGNEAKPNFLNAYLLSIACQYDYLNELYTKDSGEYERRFKKLFKWWGLDSERFVFISSAGEVDEENSLFLPDTEVVLMPGENNNIPFVIVLFRGSELLSFDLVSSFRDWIVADMDARPTYLDPDTMGEADGDSELMVHTGFWKAFSSVKYRLKAELSEKFPDHRIWVTGNSLGGALANLCGMWLHLNGFKNNMEAVYSFAAPRCGNWKLNEMYYNKMRDKCFRWVNGVYSYGGEINRDNQDVVTKLPPSKLVFIRDPYGYINTVYPYDSLPEEIRNFIPTPNTEISVDFGYRDVGKEQWVYEVDKHFFGVFAENDPRIRAHYTKGYSRGILKEVIRRYGGDIVRKLPPPSA